MVIWRHLATFIWKEICFPILSKLLLAILSFVAWQKTFFRPLGLMDNTQSQRCSHLALLYFLQTNLLNYLLSRQITTLIRMEWMSWYFLQTYGGFGVIAWKLYVIFTFRIFWWICLKLMTYGFSRQYLDCWFHGRMGLQ